MRRGAARGCVPGLSIARGDLDRVRAHARRGAPEEVCGILIGRRDAEGIHVERIVATANGHPEPRVGYLIPPEDLLRVAVAAEDVEGMEVVGFYHSHPAGPPRLSATDVALASWPGAAYVLVWPEGIGCWTWNETERRFEPIGIETRADRPLQDR